VTAHQKTQVARFVRLFVAMFVPTLIAYDGAWTRQALLALVVPSIETAWRQIFPAVPATDIAGFPRG